MVLSNSFIDFVGGALRANRPLSDVRPEGVKKVSLVILRKIEGCFKFYASFMGVLRVFQEKLWAVPRDLQKGSFKGLSWKFQRSFKGG